MRVVIVTVEPPDPFGNAASRWFYVLHRGLVDRGHEVTMISTCSDPESRHRAEALFPRPQYDLQCFAEGRFEGALGKLKTALRPFSYCYSESMVAAVERELSKPFHVLHLEHLWSAWVGWRHAGRALLNVHFLYSADLAGTPPANLYDRVRRRSSFFAERRILRHFPHVAALTDRLTADIERLVPGRGARVLPLGIDSTLYPFQAEDPPGPLTVGLIGNFSWTPTFQAAERVLTRLWPRIKQAAPEARLLMVGRDAVKRLGSSRDEAVEIVENVPEIFPYFQRLHVLLYPPPFGSGTKVKVQESMALGVPVVTNTDGGEGIPARNGEHWGFADDDDGLVEQTINLLRDRELRHSRRVAARALLEREFGPQRAISEVSAAYQAIGG